MLTSAFYYLCIVIWKVRGAIYEQSLTDFTKCDTHISRSEGKYSQFYEINRDARVPNDPLVFDFHFSVLARSDGHILLAENDVVARDDPVYEIVIGAGSNTFSDLRRLQKSSGKVTARIKGLLSAIEVRSFWIHVWSDGLIEVGQETNELAFIAWKDPEPLNLKYFSFSTWPGVEAKWYFNCKRNIVKSSELIQTDDERLKTDLLQNYDTFSRPVMNESDITDVELTLAFQYVSLDVASSRLSIKGAGCMMHGTNVNPSQKWTDEKLKWNPNDYGDIKFLNLPPYKLWTPDLRFHDYQIPVTRAILYQNGSVSDNIQFDDTCWCNVENLGSWPDDVHKCFVSFHFTRDGDRIKLRFSNTTENFLQQSSSSEWTIIDTSVEYDNLTDENVDYDADEPPKLTFSFTLRRVSTVYKLIFLTPFLVISISSLCTFWTSALGYAKITLCCIQLIIESIVLVCISSIIPGHSTTVPTLVRLYSDSLISTVILVIIAIVVINLCRNEHKKYSMPDVIYLALSSNILLKMLLLPTPQNDNVYGKLSENSTSVKEDMRDKSPWILLATIIDRICFIIYSILYIVLISRST
ncbi:Farnesoic acid 0-methyl transferase [Popillia japonica]|uniref:Farnesoic acid 0-methyl transferase n=1 Tax=Popillia japonica TaxID=7064 RepID=A0AAW1L1G0_POPJA